MLSSRAIVRFCFFRPRYFYCILEDRVQQGEHPFPFPLSRLALGHISNLRGGISCTEDVCAIVSCLQLESIRNEGMLYRFRFFSVRRRIPSYHISDILSKFKFTQPDFRETQKCRYAMRSYQFNWHFLLSAYLRLGHRWLGSESISPRVCFHFRRQRNELSYCFPQVSAGIISKESIICMRRVATIMPPIRGSSSH